MLKKTKEGKDTLLLCLLSGLGIAGHWGLNVFFARHLSPHLYGDLSVAIKCLSLSALALFAGSEMIAISNMSEAINEKNSKLYNAFTVWHKRFLKKACCIFLILLVSTLGTLLISREWSFFGYEMHLTIYFLFAAPFVVIFKMYAAYLQASGRAVFASLFRNITSGMFLFLLISLIYFFQVELNAPALFWAYFFGYFLIAGLALYAYQVTVSKNILSNMKTTQLKNNQTFYAKQAYWRNSSLLNMPNTVLFRFLGFIDLLSLELFGRIESEVGYYQACVLISGFFFRLIDNLYSPLISKLSSGLKSEEKQKKLQLSINKTLCMGFAIMICLLSLVWLFSNPILMVFGKEYIKAKLVLKIFLLDVLLGYLCYLPDSLLVMQGKAKSIAKAQTYILPFYLAACILGAHYYGMLGAAVSMFIYYFVYGVSMLLIAKKTLPKIKTLILI
tara:strand:+ start:1520 stop:2854 length:1335 start_codon:yes stop_codon:yes gene_type:complete